MNEEWIKDESRMNQNWIKNESSMKKNMNQWWIISYSWMAKRWLKNVLRKYFMMNYSHRWLKISKEGWGILFRKLCHVIYGKIYAYAQSRFCSIWFDVIKQLWACWWKGEKQTYQVEKSKPRKTLVISLVAKVSA